MPKKRDVNFEMNLSEEWLENNTGNEYCMNFMNLSQFCFIYEELNFLEERLLDSKVYIHHAQLKP